MERSEYVIINDLEWEERVAININHVVRFTKDRISMINKDYYVDKQSILLLIEAIGTPKEFSERVYKELSDDNTA